MSHFHSYEYGYVMPRSKIQLINEKRKNKIGNEKKEIFFPKRRLSLSAYSEGRTSPFAKIHRIKK